MTSVDERLTVKNMKKYLKEKQSSSVANKVKKANLMKMYNKCSDFPARIRVKLLFSDK